VINRGFDLAGVIVGGLIVAGLVRNWTGTKVLINGVTDWWKVSVNGLLGQTS
jgi:hypothetical protein